MAVGDDGCAINDVSFLTLACKHGHPITNAALATRCEMLENVLRKKEIVSGNDSL